jgi:hypothetical protein
MAGKSNRSQFLDKSAFAGISPIAKRNKGAKSILSPKKIWRHGGASLKKK